MIFNAQQQIIFAKDPLQQERLYSVGNHFPEFLDFWQNLSQYDYSQSTEKALVWVRARDIEGVSLDQQDARNMDGFWCRYKNSGNYTMKTMQKKACKLESIYQRMTIGDNMQDIMEDPALGPAAQSYLGDVISIKRIGHFFCFVGDGRHRILGAQSIDTIIPVYIEGTYSRREIF